METTLTLRSRLGFDDTVLWKQFCAKRLHLIHTLSLNSRKASEQEEQVRSIASDFCAEYGFSASAQSDFEKLIIAGIQSVRRNQKRLQRHAMPSTVETLGPGLSQPVPSAQPQPTYSFIAHPVAAGGYGLPQHLLPAIGGATQHLAAVQQAQLQQAQLQHAQLQQAQLQQAQVQQAQQAQAQQAQAQQAQAQQAQLAAHHLAQHPAPHSVQHPVPQHSIPSSFAVQHVQPAPPLAPVPAGAAVSGLSAKLETLRGLFGPHIPASSTPSEDSRSSAIRIAAEGIIGAVVGSVAMNVGSNLAQTQAMHMALLAGSLRDAFARSVGAPTSALFMEAVGTLAASAQGPALLSALQAALMELASASPDVAGMLRLLLAQYPPLRVYTGTRGQATAPNTPTHGALPSPPQTSSAPSTAASMPFIPPHTAPATAPPSAPITPATIPAMSLKTPVSAHMPQNPSAQLPPASQSPAQPQLERKLSTQEQGTLPQSAQPVQMQPVQPQPGAQTPTDSPVQNPVHAPPVSTSTPDVPPEAQRIAPLVPQDRLVTLKYDARRLELTYSPMKATPPALTEIIDNARQTFGISNDRVVRVKDTQRGKIIETNAELLDAFSRPTITLEILLPPPMLHDVSKHARNINFASLAPILQSNGK